MRNRLSLVLVLLALFLAGCAGGQRAATTVVPTSLLIAPAAASQPAGTTQQFTATATFSDNSTRDVTSQALWASSAESIATVTRSGGVGMGVAPGEAVISASFSDAGGTVTASARLTVTTAEIQSIEVSPALGQLDLGANQQFTAIATMADGTTRDVTQNAAWTSTDADVLRVDTTAGRIGLASTRKPGAATVIATVDRTSGSTAIAVVRRVPKFLYAGGVFGITGYTIEATTGALREISGAKFTNAVAVISLAVSRDRRFLYAADAGLGGIWEFQIDAGGSLVPVHDFPVITSAPISIVTHPTADFLFAVDADTGDITTFSIAANGALTALPSPAPLARQPLYSTITPDGRFLYSGARDAATATIVGFSIGADGVLARTPGSPTPTGIRPRTLTVEPSGRFLYATIPNSSLGPSTSVFGYAIDSVNGNLTQLTGSPFAAGESPLFAAADPSGRFLYVTNLANSPDGNSVSGFAIDASTGTLTNLPGSPFPAPISPVSLIVDPSGKFVYVGMDANQGVRAFAIDDRSGALTEIVGSPFPAPGQSLALAVTY